MVSSSLFCPICGAANTPQALSCFACGQALDASSLAALPAQPADILLKQRYHILHRLGQGGMGSVYKAEDSAIYILHQMLTSDDPSLKPFFFAPLSMRGPRRLQSLLNQMLDMDASKRPDDALLVKQKLQDIAQQDLSAYTQHPVQPIQTVQPAPIVPTFQTIQTVPTPPVQRSPIGEELITYTQHSDWIAALAWSPDGKYIASASYDRTVQVWEPSTGEMQRLYTGHNGFWAKGRVNAVSWSPDSTCVVSGSDDKTAQIWDASTGETFVSYREHRAGVVAVSWSADGEKIASASDVVVHVWDPSGDALISYAGFSRGIQTLAWSPDSTWLAIGVRDNVVYVYDYTKGQTDKQHAVNYREHSDFVQSLAWSPDNRLIASASNDKTVRVWDPYTGRTLLTYKGHLYAVKAVAWSSDGMHIASAGADETVQIWDAHTGKQSFIYKGHFAVIYALAWSHAGRYVASGDAHNLIHVWRAV